MKKNGVEPNLKNVQPLKRNLNSVIKTFKPLEQREDDEKVDLI